MNVKCGYCGEFFIECEDFVFESELTKKYGSICNDCCLEYEEELHKKWMGES